MLKGCSKNPPSISGFEFDFAAPHILARLMQPCACRMSTRILTIVCMIGSFQNNIMDPWLKVGSEDAGFGDELLLIIWSGISNSTGSEAHNGSSALAQSMHASASLDMLARICAECLIYSLREK